MAIQNEAYISLFKEEQSLVPEIKVGEPKDTIDIPKRVSSCETPIEETLHSLEQDIDQQEVKERGHNECYQSYEEEQEFTRASTRDNEDLVEEREPKDIKHDELLTCAPPSNEAIPKPISPAQEEEDEVSRFHFQVFDDTLFYDLGSEEALEDPLDVSSLYDKGNYIVDNIDEFIHVRKCKWDVIWYDGDPIYDIEVHFQMFPLQLSYEVTDNFDIWQQRDDTITNIFQTPKDDLVLCSPNDFRSYLEDFDEYSFEHLDLFHE
jgi:hypothetical protein